MTITLDTTTVQSLVNSRGIHDSLVNVLYIKREQKVLVNLVRLLQKLEQESPDLVARVRLRDAIQQLMKFPAHVQKQVLRYSSVRFWVEVAWGLVYKHAHLKFPEMHIETHLQDFWRIPMACALLAGQGDFTCDIVSNSQGCVALPGTARYIVSSRMLAYTRVHVRCQAGGMVLAVQGQDIPYQLCQIPTVRSIELNAVDHDHRLNGRTALVYEELDEISLVKWQSVLEESLGWIEQANALLYEEIIGWTTAFVPVVSKSVEVHLSVTFHQSPSIMALSWTPDSTVMSEAIVHEYHHQKLNALMDVTDLMAGAYSEAIYYSPWRPDPRPLSGIYHGAFVFQAVLAYWQDFFRNGVQTYDTARVQQRMHLVSYQTAAALGTLLSEAELTDIGRALVEGMQSNLDVQSENLPDIGTAIQERIRASMQQHRDTWLATHQGDARAHTAVVAKTVPPVSDSSALHELVAYLGISEYTVQLLPIQLQARFFEDVILTKVVALYDEQRLTQLHLLLHQQDTSSAIVVALVRGHSAYIKGEYVAALDAYSQLLQHLPSAAYVWSLVAFALRHIGEVEIAQTIFDQLGVLMSSPVAATPTEREHRQAWAKAQAPALAEVWHYVDSLAR